MGQSEELWNRYCSFHSLEFSKQLELNREQLQRHLDRWSGTATALLLNCRGLKQISQAPVTDYADYPFLESFGRSMEEAATVTPKTREESRYEFYTRVAASISGTVQEYLPETMVAWAKTTGTTGKSKSLIYCDTFLENLDVSLMAGVAFACSDSWGETRLREGDRCLNIIAPVPYLSGYAGALLRRHKLVGIPPSQVIDMVPDIRRRFYIALEMIEKGARIDIAGGSASTFYLACKYFLERDKFFKEYYDSMDFGIAKLYFLLKRIGAKIRNPRFDLGTLFPIKGLPLFGADTSYYSGFIQDTFGLEPANIYGSTELGLSMLSPPDRKRVLMPNLRGAYLEFLDEHGNLFTLDEVKKNTVYDLVGTPFGTPLIRYDVGDSFRVDSIRDDGMPLFTFEGRKNDFLELYGYARVMEANVAEAIRIAGFRNSDRWAVTKLTEPIEHLCVLLEKEWPYDEEEASKRIFGGLLASSHSFADYVKAFNIRAVEQAVEVNYLRKGAFLRYMLHRTKAGAPLGQMKPPKIIPVNRMDIYELLRSI